MAAVLVTADSFPAFAGDSNSTESAWIRKNRRKLRSLWTSRPCMGRRPGSGSFVPLKIRLYGQSESAFQGTLTVSTLESVNNGTAEPYEYSWSVEVSPAETKNMELYVPLGQKTAGSI